MSHRPHRFLVAMILIAALTSCRSMESGGHGHSHGDGHSHGGGHSHGEHGGHGGHGDEADDGDTTAFTLYTDSHELFVELDLPVAGQLGSHHAHVTRLEDNAPASSGVFAVAYLDAERADRVVQSFAVDGVARTGIFTPRGTAPNQPGRYRLVFRYQAGNEVAEWDAGSIDVGSEPVPRSGPAEGEVTFLKETSWFIPFRIRKPEPAPLARPVTIPARVEADPRLTATVSAPAAGRVQWIAGEQATFEGRAVEAGAVLGRLVPASSFESWNALELELQRARIEHERAAAELRRVEGLVADGLLSERRLLEARAAQQNADAAVASARRERRARAGKGSGVELRAPMAGIVLEVLLEHGDTAAAGQAVARIVSDESVVVRGTLRGESPGVLDHVHHAMARPSDPERAVDLLAAGGELLGPPRLVDAHAAGVPVTWRVANDGSLVIGELVELTLGLGTPQEHLTLPQGAVVEVNTRPHVFVQVTGESFERRAVRLGPSDGRRVAVLDGVSPDDWVVTEGGFDVHVASLAGTVESHRH